MGHTVPLERGIPQAVCGKSANQSETNFACIAHWTGRTYLYFNSNLIQKSCIANQTSVSGIWSLEQKAIEEGFALKVT